MPEMLFCYCCQTHHPKDQMRRFFTRVGYRWRCLNSIEAAKGNTAERDSFGRRQTAINREASRRAADFVSRLHYQQRQGL